MSKFTLEHTGQGFYVASALDGTATFRGTLPAVTEGIAHHVQANASTTVYAVHYASAGCLPDGDGDPPYFDTVEEAAQYIASEIEEACLNAEPELTVDEVCPSLEDIISRMGAQDPRPNSLYSWSIDRYLTGSATSC